MVFENDYIMRMIQMCALMMRRLKELMQGSQDEEAEVLLSQHAQRAAGLSLDTLMQLPVEDLMRLFGTDAVGFGRALGAIEGLFAKAELLDAQRERSVLPEDSDAAALCRRKALAIALCLAPEEKWAREERYGRMRSLAKALPLEASDLLALHRWYARAGFYADAEDVLFELPEETDAAREAERFYAMLETQPEERLVQGGFSRAEIGEGRAAFIARDALQGDSPMVK